MSALPKAADTQPRRHDRNHPQTFTDIFNDYQRPIYNYLLRTTEDQAVAEDLTQETFIRVYRGLPEFRGEASLATWVYRIATNTFYDHVRRVSTRQSHAAMPIEDAGSVQGVKPSLEQALTRAEMGACVQGTISNLPENYRAVLVMSDFQGLKNREIAEILDVSLDTVKIRLHRARRNLREILSWKCDVLHDERNVLVCEAKENEDD